MNRRRLLVVIAGLVLGAAGVVARSVQISILEHGFWGKTRRQTAAAGPQGAGPAGNHPYRRRLRAGDLDRSSRHPGQHQASRVPGDLRRRGGAAARPQGERPRAPSRWRTEIGVAGPAGAATSWRSRWWRSPRTQSCWCPTSRGSIRRGAWRRRLSDLSAVRSCARLGERVSSTTSTRIWRASRSSIWRSTTRFSARCSCSVCNAVAPGTTSS